MVRPDFSARRAIIGGASFKHILRLLVKVRLRIHPKFWYRFFMAASFSLFCTSLRIIEKIRFTRAIKRTKISSDPIFIIGHWRTGTTFLNNILMRDTSRAIVTNLQSYAPHFFLTAYNFTKSFVDFALPEQRPMDNIQLDSLDPAEEEFAISNSCLYSFYNAFVFPRYFDYFSRFITFAHSSPKIIRRWKKLYLFFLKKITYFNHGKQLILKNPVNTGRIRVLLELFPDAKFIHLVRNPYKIFASTNNLFQSTLPLFSLQKWNNQAIEEGFIRNFINMYEQFLQDIKLIPKGNIVEIRYENLAKNPLEIIEKIYSNLSIDGFDENKKNFLEYINQQRDYKTNVYNYPQELKNKVKKFWGWYLQTYYPKLL